MLLEKLISGTYPESFQGKNKARENDCVPGDGRNRANDETKRTIEREERAKDKIEQKFHEVQGSARAAGVKSASLAFSFEVNKN